MPWEKKSNTAKASENYVSVGALSAYRVVVDKDDSDNWQFD